MPEQTQNVTYDVEGYDVLTTALRELLNGFPGLDSGDEIAFAVLNEDSGKAMFPISGAVIVLEKRDILGNVYQECQYPFTVCYRAAGLSESRKAAVKEWLDTLGRWLEGQPVTIGGTTYTLSAYPALTGSRKLKKIERKTPGHLDSIEQNNSENWVIALAATYTNEFSALE